MTLAQICDGVDITKSEAISGYYSITKKIPNGDFYSLSSLDDSYFEITPDDKTYSKIIELFETHTFRRSLKSFLPQGTKFHSHVEGEFKWDVMFHFNYITYSDGSVHSGTLIHVSNFYDIIEIHFNITGEVLRCTTSDADQWLEDILNIISENKD